MHPIDSQAKFHKYGVEWTAEKIDWLIDGVVVRTLTPSQVKGDYYPQTPMTARIGVWAGGDPDNTQGTISKHQRIWGISSWESDRKCRLGWRTHGLYQRSL